MKKPVIGLGPIKLSTKLLCALPKLSLKSELPKKDYLRERLSRLNKPTGN
jgi:hypothetical protein